MYFIYLTDARKRSEAQHKNFRLGRSHTLTPPFMARLDRPNLAQPTPSRKEWIPRSRLLAKFAPSNIISNSPIVATAAVAPAIIQPQPAPIFPPVVLPAVTPEPDASPQYPQR